MDRETEYIIGEAFDMSEEAISELEEQAAPRIRALARKLPEPQRRELLRIWREHGAYSIGALRSACARLYQIVGEPYVREGNRLRYKPLVETPTLPTTTDSLAK